MSNAGNDDNDDDDEDDDFSWQTEGLLFYI